MRYKSTCVHVCVCLGLCTCVCACERMCACARVFVTESLCMYMYVPREAPLMTHGHKGTLYKYLNTKPYHMCVRERQRDRATETKT